MNKESYDTKLFYKKLENAGTKKSFTSSTLGTRSRRLFLSFKVRSKKQIYVIILMMIKILKHVVKDAIILALFGDNRVLTKKI